MNPLRIKPRATIDARLATIVIRRVSLDQAEAERRGRALRRLLLQGALRAIEAEQEAQKALPQAVEGLQAAQAGAL